MAKIPISVRRKNSVCLSINILGKGLKREEKEVGGRGSKGEEEGGDPSRLAIRY